MIQIVLEVLIIGLLTMMAGIILMVVNNIIDKDPSPTDKL